MRTLVGASALASLLAISACSPVLDTAPCTITCGPENSCPSDLMCVRGYCSSSSDVCTKTSPTFVEMSAGAQHTCGIDLTGALYCWGDNEFGQLGFYNADDFGMPVASPTLVTVSAVVAPVVWKHVSAGANHTCATTSIDTLFCWGDNAFFESAATQGATQNGLNIAAPSPVNVVDSSNAGVSVSWAGVAAGDGFTCALGYDGVPGSHTNVYCWGNNADGELGRGELSAADAMALPADNLTDADQLDAGDLHICAHLKSDHVACWGRNQNSGDVFTGQALPTMGSDTAIATPTEIPNLNNAASVSAGIESTCALLRDGSIQCWGLDVDGSLGGAGTGDVQTVPIPDAGGQWLAVADGNDTGCGIFQPPTPTGGAVPTSLIKCWGHDQSGDRGAVTPEVGAPNPTPLANTPTPIANVGTNDFVATNLTLGTNFACAYDGLSGEICWGQNQRGQTGQPIVQRTASLFGITENVASPMALAAGSNHTCEFSGLGNDYLVFCWGLNDVHQVSPTPSLSLATYRDVGGTIALRFATLTKFRQPNFISAGAKHSCVQSTELTGDVVACWGANDANQLPGQLTNQRPYAEFQIPVDAKAFQLSSGSNFNCLNAKNLNQRSVIEIPLCWGSLGGAVAPLTYPMPVAQLDYGTSSAAIQSLGIASNSVWAGVSVKIDDVIHHHISYWGDPLLTASDAPASTSLAAFTTSAGVTQAGADVQEVAQGTAAHRCYAGTSGELICGGPNDAGQIPGAAAAATVDLTPTSARFPMLATAFAGWPDNTKQLSHIAVGEKHTCAVTGAGKLYCWGDDSAAQLGTPANSNGDGEVAIPSNESGNSTWVAVAAGARHTCATLRLGASAPMHFRIYCWGAGESGQLGVDHSVNEPSFQRLPTPL